MYYNRKKELIKNIILITAIFALAIISTYYIYNRFDNSEVVDYTSESLDITYKEDNGDKIAITNVTPVTDSVGLSTPAHTVTVKNNLTEKVSFSIKVFEDIKTMAEDNCSEYQIPRKDIRISIRNSKGKTNIYNLEELTDDILIYDDIPALKEQKYTIRLWVSNESSLPMGSDLHYHGIIEVVEEHE